METGWLNSRAKDRVGRGMEGELWAAAREIMERIEKREGGNEGAMEVEGEQQEGEEEGEDGKG